MPTLSKTLTIKSSRHNRDARIEDSNTTRVTITIAPEAGERFSREGMGRAAKVATIAAFELATAFLRAIPPGCAYCVPSVDGGDTWAGGASASVTFEHDGVEVAIAAIKNCAEQARK